MKARAAVLFLIAATSLLLVAQESITPRPPEAQYFGEYNTGEKITELIRQQPAGRIEIVAYFNPEPPAANIGRISLTQTDLLTFRVPVVIVGKIVGDGSSFVTANDEFLASSYPVRIERVLKDTTDQSLAPDTVIPVIRGGGKLTQNGRTIVASDPNFAEFENGGTYLLFLFYFPDTKSYKAISYNSFQLAGDGVHSLSADHLFRKFAAQNTPESLISETEASVARLKRKGNK